MNTRLREVQATREKQTITVRGQLEQANSRIAILRRNLNLDADTNTLNAWARELKNLVENIMPVLESKIKAVEKGKKEVAEFNTLLERVKADWNGLSFDEKRRFVNMVTSKVVITEASPHLLKLEVYWNEPYNEMDTGYIWNARGGETKWSDEEQAILREMYPTADRADILNRLPSRSWNMIRNFTRRHMELQRNKHNLNTSPLHSSLSVEDDKLLTNMGVRFSEELLNGTCEWVAARSNSKSLY